MSKPSDDHGVVVEKKTKIKKPKMYRVILLNDDYTTMEFVVMILTTVFHKSHTVANQLMLQIHHQGQGVCGVYTHEVAEMKVATVTEMARHEEYPLRCIMEED